MTVTSNTAEADRAYDSAGYIAFVAAFVAFTWPGSLAWVAAAAAVRWWPYAVIEILIVVLPLILPAVLAAVALWADFGDGYE